MRSATSQSSVMTFEGMPIPESQDRISAAHVAQKTGADLMLKVILVAQYSFS